MSAELQADSSARAGDAMSLLQTAITASGLSTTFRRDAPAVWKGVSDKLAYQPVMYATDMIDYQLAYMWGAELMVEDVSLVLYHDHQPCAIWPLTLITKENPRLCSHGGPVSPPLFVRGLSAKTVKSVTLACLDFVDAFARSLAQTEWESALSFVDETGLSEWHARAMQRGASVGVRHELFIDLSLDMATIKSSFRKSYKSLISAGSKLWKVGVLTGEDVAIWQEFRELHRAVAGRVTRSADSWELQHQALAAGSAFLVYLHDAEHKMVGGGLFHYTRDEGMYAVAAYDRTLFDQPLGHVVQYRAIEELKRLGVRWYKIGPRPYSCDQPPPTEKQAAITHFKEGFASHLFPQFIISRKIESAHR